jgi:hypothetical protein
MYPLFYQIPHVQAVCLVCGALVCVSNKCCMRAGMGEGTYHAATCGAGVGVLLLARHTYVLLLRESRATQWTSVYLDEWGEEDIALKRGKPLYLNDEVSHYSLCFYCPSLLSLISHFLTLLDLQRTHNAMGHAYA